MLKGSPANSPRTRAKSRGDKLSLRSASISMPEKSQKQAGRHRISGSVCLSLPSFASCCVYIGKLTILFCSM